jgi:uncharacterized coiled-coil protein SlyX
MADFITIKQAGSLTGKHPDTIRRIIKNNKTNTTDIVRGKKGQYLLNSDWICNQLGIANKNEPFRADLSPSNSSDDEEPITEQKNSTNAHIESLERHIESLERQLAEKGQFIKTLSEGVVENLRDKEANTTKLQDQYQQLIARQLPATSSAEPMTEKQYPAEAEAPEVIRPSEPKNKKKQKPGKKQKKQTTEQVKKRWWRRKK